MTKPRKLRKGDWCQIVNHHSIDDERFGHVMWTDEDGGKEVVALSLDHGDKLLFYRSELRALPRRKR
jgi:hypothetical protein